MRRRQAPIVGEEGCTHLDGTGFFELPPEGADVAGGEFSFCLDVQPDEPVEQVIFGSRQADGAGLIFTANAGGARGCFQLELTDDRDRAFVARAQASSSSGKRILCRVASTRNELHLAELQPWAGDAEPTVSYAQRESPTPRTLDQPLAFGGLREGSTATGTFAGRVAEFAFFGRWLDDSRIPALRKASATRTPPDIPAAPGRDMADETRQVFLDDYGRLVVLTEQEALSRAETREVSVLAYRWLLDKRPVLHRIADHYGTQLSLPDLNPMRAYREQVTKDRPVFFYGRDRWEGNWLPPSSFMRDPSFWLGQSERNVTWEAFVKFVRNKLGGGHYDPDDRMRWQSELNALATETRVGGEDWLDVKMLALAKALRFAVESSGFVPLARFGL